MNSSGAVHPQVAQQRAEALVTLDPRAIQGMQRQELLALQERLGYGATWGGV